MTEVGYTFKRKGWDSDFFSREIHRLSLTASFDKANLQRDLRRLDAAGVWGIECLLPAGRMGDAADLEELGFRICDSQLVFVSEISVGGLRPVRAPYGLLRNVRPEDLPQIDELTVRCIVDNPRFQSRFKDPRLFSRDESIRYYSAWNRLAFKEDPDLFAVWEVEGGVVAYFNLLRRGIQAGKVLLKGGLTAVAENHRGHGAQNTLQVFLFHRVGPSRFLLNNTTQLSNLPVIRNHLRAGRKFDHSALIFFRTFESSDG